MNWIWCFCFLMLIPKYVVENLISRMIRKHLNLTCSTFTGIFAWFSSIVFWCHFLICWFWQKSFKLCNILYSLAERKIQILSRELKYLQNTVEGLFLLYCRASAVCHPCFAANFQSFSNHVSNVFPASFFCPAFMSSCRKHRWEWAAFMWSQSFPSPRPPNVRNWEPVIESWPWTASAWLGWNIACECKSTDGSSQEKHHQLLTFTF